MERKNKKNDIKENRLVILKLLRNFYIYDLRNEETRTVLLQNISNEEIGNILVGRIFQKGIMKFCSYENLHKIEGNKSKRELIKNIIFYNGGNENCNYYVVNGIVDKIHYCFGSFGIIFYTDTKK